MTTHSLQIRDKFLHIFGSSGIGWIAFLTALCFWQAKCSDGQEEESWQQCSTFLAPSTTGWGVFAARGFAPDEIVEVSSLVLPLATNASIVKNTVLDDYVYGFTREIDGEPFELLGAMLGTTMFFNHHSEPNVEFASFSREPDPDAPGATIALGFKAKGPIQEGEELFSTYGGPTWFLERGLDLLVPPKSQTQIPQTLLRNRIRDYCSHISAGIGRPAWEDSVLAVIPEGLSFWIDKNRFAPKNAPFGNAFAKRAISNGDRIEIALALVMSRSIVHGSILSPVVFRWEDSRPENQYALEKLRENHQLFVQFQDKEHTYWERLDGFQSFEDTVLFPAAGNIGMVRRVGLGNSARSNCRLIIHSEGNAGSIAVTIELIATKDIEQGEILRLDMQPAGTAKELDMLKKELVITGQLGSIEFGKDDEL